MDKDGAVFFAYDKAEKTSQIVQIIFEQCHSLFENADESYARIEFFVNVCGDHAGDVINHDEHQQRHQPNIRSTKDKRAYSSDTAADSSGKPAPISTHLLPHRLLQSRPRFCADNAVLRQLLLLLKSENSRFRKRAEAAVNLQFFSRLIEMPLQPFDAVAGRAGFYNPCRLRVRTSDDRLGRRLISAATLASFLPCSSIGLQSPFWAISIASSVVISSHLPHSIPPLSVRRACLH